jgi:N-acetylglucosamine malate deacetylase 1
MNILVFSPHPDDDLIGCGGSMAKHIKQGNNVSVVYMTSGDAGSLRYIKEELADIREGETRDAGDFLGVHNTIFLRNADGYLEYNKQNLIKIVNLIRKEKPEIVYIPHKDDAHKDHMKTFEIVAESINRASGPWFQECDGDPWVTKSVLCYEVWTPLQEVSYVEDITDFIDQKVDALEKHASQLQDIAYGDAVKGLNRYRGIMTKKGKYCECFQVVKADRLV